MTEEALTSFSLRHHGPGEASRQNVVSPGGFVVKDITDVSAKVIEGRKNGPRTLRFSDQLPDKLMAFHRWQFGLIVWAQGLVVYCHIRAMD